MILRTPPPRKRRAESQPHEDNNTQSPSSHGQLLVYEDLPAPEYSHDHSIPVTSDQMLCTYQCRQMVKSEFFDALSSAEKQAHDYQSKFEALNEDFEKSESERKKLRDKFFNTEQELAAARGREHILQEQLRKELDFSQEQLRKKIQAFSELEINFRNEMGLRKNAESSAAKAEEKAHLLEEKLNTLSETIDREKGHLQNELVQMRSESKLSVSRISADLERMECRANNAEKESAFLSEQLEELKKQLDEGMQEKFELQKKLSIESPEAPSRDNSLLVKHLREELRNYESEVLEARKIKASHEDIELLKEKLHEEKNRRERAELDLLKLSDLQSNVKNLEDELSTWKSLIKELPGVSSADDIPSEFAALQKKVVDSMRNASEIREKVIEVQVALDKAILDKQNAETEVAMVNEKAESYKADIKRLELMLGLTTEERDRLKDVVKELNDHKKLEGGTGLVSGTIFQELEISLDKKENYVRQLENSLSEIKEINSRQHNEIKLLNERLTNEARRVKMLEREGDRLRSEISLLESKLGHGDFSSANTKVLRMVNTLAVDNEAKQTIEALQNELQKTREKLLAVEELKKQSSDAGTHVDSYVAAKIKQLKEQIATLEKREERYKTVFAERISVFRRACCELFGYKIVMDDHQRPDGIPVTRFTLHSIYAMSDDEKLQFEYESGNTNIVVNEYTSQPEISRQVDIFIRKMNSVPAFTANLTVESFNKRTLS
ncbi:mitotic checkpoint family protein [Perilla frutescens var. hirtella]|uniref:Mitotic checkpoint family protein n=1 Tax=Perilla frutescens var. hirtella TaxID=608512 RepID=A0AAD4P3U7_PERFH|nr:mitotic checkpoint family protein [Perilla frutescens var. hirtella]